MLCGRDEMSQPRTDLYGIRRRLSLRVEELYERRQQRLVVIGRLPISLETDHREEVMVNIIDWLDDRVQEIVDLSGHHAEKSDFRDQAKALVEAGVAEGFSIAEMKDACAGDVERYLLDHQNAMSDVLAQQRGDGSAGRGYGPH